MDFSSELCNSYESSSASFRNHPHHQHPNQGNMKIPHRGSLCQVEGDNEIHFFYVLEILLQDESTHELVFQRRDFEFSLRLFAIMDTESNGQVTRAIVKEFVTLRCPVFWRRDDDLQAYDISNSADGGTASPTFDEVWQAVATCSKKQPRSITAADGNAKDNLSSIQLGVEGWMVFCRFIALAQYLEAKRRFSGRHLQQTMRHRNSPRGSELVVVDVPPPAPPLPLSPGQLANYERESNKCLPLPELDLDHSLLAAHDILRRRKSAGNSQGHVKIDLFGSSSSSSSIRASGSSNSSVEFCLTYSRHRDEDSSSSDSIAVRRSMADMKWLNDTFISHKALGGTLCGRIFPPFPGSSGRFLASQFQDDSAMSGTNGAIAAAAAGVGMIKDGIKSLWGNYLTTSSASSAPTTAAPERTAPTPKPTKKATSVGRVLPESYYNPNSPAGKARHLERYLNYLLEHPALSTSFPLNTILKASQSGLEAAKQSLDEHTLAASEIKEQTPQLDDGKLLTFFTSPGSSQPNLSWVRTAAQAAMALQLHGILETTGLPSASAKLQQASLPKFGSSRNSAWNAEESDIRIAQQEETIAEGEAGESFEEGVEHVSDELESECIDENVGYDLLPLPVPAPERQILSLGESPSVNSMSSEQRETRFRYGSPTVGGRFEDDLRSAYLGDIAVDENIDKLREVIGSVDNTLSRCLASSGGIGRARRERLALHLEVVRGLDSWEGLRGKFVSQRALLKGVSGIQQSKEVFEESDLALIDDVSWQTALANSAVSAAEDVRSTVRAARTAANAKAAASSAAFAAQTACESGKFNSIDEARAAQTRASIAQSHAIYSAVVEHEAKTVKRRATLALAHDVKCWNVHRKREVLQTCIAYARSQHEATRRAVDAWSCLRDGYVGSTVIPSTQVRKTAPSAPVINAGLDSAIDEVTATIYNDVEGGESGPPIIVAVEHDLFKQPADMGTVSGGEIISAPEPETILPLVMASPIPEEDDDFASFKTPEIGASFSSRTSFNSHGFGSSMNSHCGSQGFLGSPGSQSKAKTDAEEEEALTSSMQSLVNGLMNWGGQYDSEEDFALPRGMAASIAMEESGVLGGPPKIA